MVKLYGCVSHIQLLYAADFKEFKPSQLSMCIITGEISYYIYVIKYRDSFLKAESKLNNKSMNHICLTKRDEYCEIAAFLNLC